MSNDNLENITEKIDSLTLEILGPLRSSKTLNQAALQQLDAALSELENALSNKDVVPKNLVGNLWFIFTSMLTEAEYAKERRQNIESAAWAIEDKLRKIFGPRF